MYYFDLIRVEEEGEAVIMGSEVTSLKDCFQLGPPEEVLMMSSQVPRQRFVDKFFVKEMLPEDLLGVMGKPG